MTKRSDVSRLCVAALAALLLTACSGAAAERASPQVAAANIPEASPSGGERDDGTPETEGTPERTAEAPLEAAPTEAAVLTTCRALRTSEGDAVELRRAPSVRTRPRRVGPRANAAGFSADGSHLVYQHPAASERSATPVCGANVLGAALVALDVRSRRCRVVTASEPTYDSATLALSRVDQPSDVVTRLPVWAGGGLVATPRRDASDMRTVTGLGLRNARPIRIDSTLLLAVDEELRLRVIDGTDAPRLLLPADVRVAAGPSLLSAPRRLAVLSQDRELYLVDLSSETPSCTMVSEGVSMYSDITRSARFLAFARVASSGRQDYEVMLADLDRGVVRPVGHAAGATMLTLHAVGGEERFVMQVRGADTSALFEVDGASGAVRRLGLEQTGAGDLAVSPDGRFMAYSLGSLPGRPPQPESSFQEDRIGEPRLGCDPMPPMPGGCGWTSDGCGGFTYLGDCPELVRARERALRDSGLYLVAIPRPVASR